MKDIFYSFYTTTAGISNALIFLDEKRNIINNLDFYNYNPWKADWIYTKAYQKERRDTINLIREDMDYKGEVSDDEDSIIKYDESHDQLNEQIRKFNRRSIAREERPNIKTEDKPMINNEEIITGKVDENEEDEDDEISQKILNNFKDNKINIIKGKNSLSEKGKRIFNDKMKNNNMNNYYPTLNNKNMKINFQNDNINNNMTNNYYMNVQSENNLIDDGTLNPQQDLFNRFKK